MLILVAVVLTIALGDNGILKKARDAKAQQSAHQAKESEVFLGESFENSINSVVNGEDLIISTEIKSKEGENPSGNAFKGKKFYEFCRTDSYLEFEDEKVQIFDDNIEVDMSIPYTVIDSSTASATVTVDSEECTIYFKAVSGGGLAMLYAKDSWEDCNFYALNGDFSNYFKGLGGKTYNLLNDKGTITFDDSSGTGCFKINDGWGENYACVIENNQILWFGAYYDSGDPDVGLQYDCDIEYKEALGMFRFKY